ncbi:MAG: AbrB/MazE/SpoVT family DNA-binding domain-containing protein [Saprospiraceae bacterium]|nr:AbrB/MazE/SpoVT family DNA-binding domain-containing protein [Saprospiraceae bacterium]MBK7812021.1 AbrB/MazE/SpoVT family DNA-binding domain-containing protein [Saprospiraceae bacterium]MBK9632773.1 AbrB/MazE/SpoVT family DNA-binding domain-containing protein [Saprospiraceae bacterium]
MKVKLVNIGNLKRICLSKSSLKKYSITDKVELVLEHDYIAIKYTTEPRKNCEEAFLEMRKDGDDNMLIGSILEAENMDKKWVHLM